jgi:queuine/archaeosine tRNA-ribosyltransferase
MRAAREAITRGSYDEFKNSFLEKLRENQDSGV